MFVLRLIREIGKDWKTFTIATLLLVISSFVEVYIPQVVRYTIDNYVLPKYAIHRETGKFVDITKLNRWEISEKVYPERFFKTPYGYKKPGEIFSLPVEKIYEYRREDLMKIRLMFFILVIMLITRFVSSYGYIYLGNKVAQNISNKLRIRTFKHALNLPLSYFNKTPLGVVLTRLTNDISAITLAYTDGFLIMLKDIFMFFLAVFIMVSISLKLTLLVLLIMPLVLMFSYVFSKIVGRAWRNVRTLIANLNAFLQETIWGLKIVQNLGIYAPMNARFGILNEKLYVAYMKVVYVYGVFMPLISLMSYIATAIIIWYSAEGILKNELTFGSLVAFLSYVDILFQPIVEFGQRLQNLQSAVAGYEKVDGFLKEKVEISSGKSVVYNKTATVIEFDNVSFSYDGKKNAVSNIKLTVMNGEKVALVGKTGSGKSTLLNLMMGFYIPTSGEVKIMGLSTREWDKKLLRSLFAPVMQELTVFSDTMENNITLGYNLRVKGSWWR